MTREEKRIFEILTKLVLPSMPPVLQEGDDRIWYKALAEINTMVGTIDYAVVRNDGNKGYIVSKVFGDKGFHSVIRIHPYEFIDDSKAPKPSSPAFIEWLGGVYGVPKERIKELNMEQKRAFRVKALIDIHRNRILSAENAKKTIVLAQEKRSEIKEVKEEYFNNLQKREQ